MPLHLSVHIMEGRVKILEACPKSEEIIRFHCQFSCICRHGTVLAIMLNRTARLSAHLTEGKHKILGTNKKSEEIIRVYLIFPALGHFYFDVVKRNNAHIFHTGPSLLTSAFHLSMASYICVQIFG